MNLADLVDLEWQLLQDESALKDGKGAAVAERDRELGELVLRRIGSDPESARTRALAEPPFRRRLATAWIGLVRERNPALPGLGVEKGYRLVGALLAVFGGLLGIGTAKAVLHYDGHSPVNVFYFIAVFLVLQVILLLIMVIAMVFRSALGDSEMLGWMQRLIKRISRARWVASLLGRAHVPKPPALGALRGRAGLYSDVERWLLFALVQRFGLWFNIAALVTCLSLVVFTDLAFSWSTTIDMDAGKMHGWFHGLATPWAWVSDRLVPSLELVEKSRWSQMGGYSGGDPVRNMESVTIARQWWTYLVAGLVTFGLIPRLCAWSYGTWRYTRELRATTLDHVAFQRLYERLLPFGMTIEAPDPASVGVVSPAAAPESARAKEARSKAQDEGARKGSKGTKEASPASSFALGVVAWGRLAAQKDATARALSKRFGSVAAAALGAGGADLAEDDASLAALRRRAPTRTVLAVEPGVQPTKEILAFLAGVREAVGQRAAISVVVIAPNADGTWSDAEPDELRQWERRLEASADPYLGVERLRSPA